MILDRRLIFCMLVPKLMCYQFLSLIHGFNNYSCHGNQINNKNSPIIGLPNVRNVAVETITMYFDPIIILVNTQNSDILIFFLVPKKI